MRKFLWVMALPLSLLLAGGGVAAAQSNKGFPYNADERAVGPYTLEDPLCFTDGRPVRCKAGWKARRSEILSLFEREMYGRIPGPEPLHLQTLEDGIMSDGSLRRTVTRMRFRPDCGGPCIDWTVFAPEGHNGSLPVVLMLRFADGITELCDPVQAVTSRGYALVCAFYNDISPDPARAELQDSLAFSGIFDLWPDSGTPDGPRALGAWAWALMRGMDLIETLPGLDAGRVVLAGSSRLGKAALVAAAWDERFAVICLNQTGGGGVPLAKRYFGENVLSETSRFRHWFSPAYAKYAGCEAATMPFDQHLLVSCIAPRPLLVEGFDNPWFDTRGEFLCLKAASPVWRFLGAEGLPDVDWPDDYDTSAIGPVLGYVRRDQGHGIAAIDWTWLLDFADRALR